MTRAKMAATLAAMGLATLGLAACKDKVPDGNTSVAAADQPSMLDALGDAKGVGATSRMVKQAGLDRMFGGAGSYTLFAPTDAAVAALPEADRQRLESADGRPQLVALLRQHIAPGYIGLADINQGLARKDGTVQLATVGGQPLTLRKQGEAIVVGSGADAPRLVGQPVATRNGVIFPIDRVLPPPSVK
ncbi:fasciclin domain-containing protein [Sphingomonas floccifaciens]|uniref:Fasciclin domain-containing protein n=1 Tax=Sphingomonas floccifaciens TaxID=1844115 RepID=A0ABW4NE68_9SPHN